MFQGHVYSLIGASGDDRFALMHAGFKHRHGLDGFPQDLDMAYGYYSNVGSQSSMDRSRVHEYKVTITVPHSVRAVVTGNNVRICHSVI